MDIQKVDNKVFLLNGETLSRSYRAFSNGDYVSIVGDNEKIENITIKTYYKNITVRDSNGSIINYGGSKLILVRFINSIVNESFVRKPTFRDSAQRRFFERNDSILIDSISGRNGTILWPISSFNGVDGSVGATLDITSWSSFYAEGWFKTSLGGNFLFSIQYSSADDIRLWLPSNKLVFQMDDGIDDPFLPTDKLVNDNEWYFYECELTGGNQVLRLYDSSKTLLETKSGVKTFNFPGASGILAIGSRLGNSFFYNGHQQGVKIGETKETVISIPIPHLGYGIDPSQTVGSQGVPLTVSNVTEDYDENGSKWLVEHGAIARNPELVTNGNLSNGLIGYINRADIPFDIFENIDDRLHLSTPSGVKVAGNNSFELKVNVVYIIEVDSEVIAGNWSVTAYTSDDLVSSPVAVGNIVDGKNTFKLSFTSVIKSIGFATDIGGGEAYFDNISIKQETPDYIPNNTQGQPIVPITVGDIFIPGTSFLNTTPFLVDMSRPNGAESEEVVNGDFSNGLDSWLNRADVPFSTYELVDGRLHLADTSIKVAGNNSISIPANTKFIAEFEAELISGEFNFAGRPTNDLTGAPKTICTILNSDRYVCVFSDVAITEAVSFASIASGGEIYIDNLSIKLATPEILFFDKSDTTIWSNAVRSSDYYDSNNPFLWHQSELTDEFVKSNCLDDNKYRLWIRIANNQFRDILYYNYPLVGVNIEDAEDYVSS